MTILKLPDYADILANITRLQQQRDYSSSPIVSNQRIAICASR